ncbi:hypothetical protein [Phytobacter diazotrophicus]|uniref:hypothetical protein n=1 Tax=Phytobacter diazotrophicus TaxID=395631 RepID=UPI002FFA9A18
MEKILCFNNFSDVKIPVTTKPLNPSNISFNSKVTIRTDKVVYLDGILTSHADSLVGCPVVKVEGTVRGFAVGYNCEVVAVIRDTKEV